MSKIAQKIPAILKALEVSMTLEERNTFVMASIARALSLDLQLPTSPLDGPEMHFIDAHALAVGARVAAINEEYIIDTTYLFDLVRQFYLLRYSLVHDARNSSRVFSVAAMQAPDKIPGILATSLQRFSTVEADAAFNEIVWAVSVDAGVDGSIQPVSAPL